MRLGIRERVVIGMMGLTLVVTGIVDGSAMQPEQENRTELGGTIQLELPAGRLQLGENSVGGSGTIRYERAGATLNASQEQLLLDYMDMYYRSLGNLFAESPSRLFASDAQAQARSRQSVWETTIAVRNAQGMDLSLTGYSYELICTGISRADSGDITVSVRENSVQNFAAYPGVNSQNLASYHRFTLTSTAEGWRLRAHSQMDSANMLAGGHMASADLDTDSARQALIQAHQDNLSIRRRHASVYDPNAVTSLTWNHDYNRDAAVAYARKWVGLRSGNWPAYDAYGGNCQNYASQCLYAGGIPMDYSGASQWKWYGGSPNTSQTASGRSGSWSGVKEFYAYVSSNTGYGLVAEANANFWSGEPGDLIQLGYNGNWRHVVVITRVIRDRDGRAIDYLISSNTADLRDYPVSAYMYPQQRLIRIYGWNSQ